MRAIGNIAAVEDDTYSTAVMAALDANGEAAVLPSLLAILSHGPEPLHRLLRMDACWVVGNLGSGPPAHVDALVGAGAIVPLVSTLERGAFDLKRESAMALWQICKDGRHMHATIEAGALPHILDLIRLPVRHKQTHLPICSFTPARLSLMYRQPYRCRILK